MTKPLMIREMPYTERPQTRLVTNGPAMLSDAELLALVGQVDSLDTAQRILAHVGSLAQLLRMDTSEIEGAAPGVGAATAARIKAAMELGRRAAMQTTLDRYQITSPSAVSNYLSTALSGFDQEHLVVLCLDTKNRIQKLHTVYIGSVNCAMIRVSEVLKPAVLLNSPSIVLGHNHPSGDATPSLDDISVTTQIIQAAKLMDIEVLDHVVVSAGSFVSMRERGMASFGMH